MIELSENSIIVLFRDGTSAPFDSFALLDRIAKSCAQTGMENVWIAEDIALSVEFAITSKTESSAVKTISSSDIDLLVIRILEDTGYHEVADVFKKNCGAIPETPVSMSEKNIAAAIASGTGVAEDQLPYLTEKVTAALKSIGVVNCSQRLMVELARYFIASAASKLQFAVEPPAQPEPAVASKTAGGKWIAEAKDIIASLEGADAGLAASKIIVPHSIGRLFPSLRLDISYHALAEKAKLNPPFTELSLGPVLLHCAESVDSIRSKAQELCVARGYTPQKGGLPLWIKFTGLRLFVVEYMGCADEQCARKYARQIADSFADMLRHRPFKISCS